jgi:hypothetical protein
MAEPVELDLLEYGDFVLDTQTDRIVQVLGVYGSDVCVTDGKIRYVVGYDTLAWADQIEDIRLIVRE